MKNIDMNILFSFVRITGLNGDINLRIPQGTSSHTEMTLSGRGIKHMESYNTYGDHIVHIQIKMPVNMTEEQKELIREYAYLEKDTPGTINGVDKSRFTNFRNRNVHEEQKKYYEERSGKEEQKSEKTTSSEDEGLLTKIVNAVNENETVKMFKKKLLG